VPVGYVEAIFTIGGEGRPFLGVIWDALMNTHTSSGAQSQFAIRELEGLLRPPHLLQGIIADQNSAGMGHL
jgi:hypothetical protein